MYVMSYYTEERPVLFLAKSEDLRKWEVLNFGNPVLSIESGETIRDPFVFRDKSGNYHLLFTNSMKGNSISHSMSNDLFNWTNPRRIQVMSSVPSTLNCWSPKACYDFENDEFVVFWISSCTGKKANAETNRLWYSTTKDFYIFSESKKLFDPEYSISDATIVQKGKTFYMGFKDERGSNTDHTRYKCIRTARANCITGPYARISGRISPPMCESPCIVQEDGGFYMFYESLPSETISAVFSYDFNNWKTDSDDFVFPKEAKHFSIVKI